MCRADCGTLPLRRGVWGPLKGAKEGERQEADRAEEFPGKKGRVKVEKGENDKEQRGGRRERKREAPEEDEEGEKGERGRRWR